jgi:hypothetical protein
MTSPDPSRPFQVKKQESRPCYSYEDNKAAVIIYRLNPR